MPTTIERERKRKRELEREWNTDSCTSAFKPRNQDAGLKRALFDARTQVINEDRRILRAVINTRDVDRFGTIIDPAGAHLDGYIKYGTVLWNHDDNYVIGRALELNCDDDEIEAVWQLVDASQVATRGPLLELVEDVWFLLSQGYIRTYSVGFLPRKPPKMRDGVPVYEDWDLTEFSVAPVPGNPNALSRNLEALKRYKRVRDRGVGLKGLGAHARAHAGRVLEESQGPYKWYSWDREEAEDWLREHDFKTSGYRKEANFHGYRQEDPDNFDRIRTRWEGARDKPDEPTDDDRPIKFLDGFPGGGEGSRIQSIGFYHGESDLGEEAERRLKFRISPGPPDCAGDDHARLGRRRRGRSLKALPHILSRVFDRPLLIHPHKLSVIISVLRDRLDEGLELEPSGSDSELDPDLDHDFHVTEDGIALIPVLGTLVQRSFGLSTLSGLTSYQQIRRQFDEALADENIKAILLDIDSPGGEVSGLFDLADHVYEARGQKPIVAFANEMAFSAAYALASAADIVLTTRTGGVGSIGVVAAHIDQSGADEAAGLDYTFIYAGEHKVDANPHQPLSDDAKDEIQGEVDRIYDLFVETVARNRGMSESDIRETEARLYWGAKAVEAGLADGLVSANEILERIMNMNSGDTDLTSGHMGMTSGHISTSTSTRAGLTIPVVVEVSGVDEIRKMRRNLEAILTSAGAGREELAGRLRDIAASLEAAPRQGEAQDEPEGARYIVLSDTLAQHFSDELCGVAHELSEVRAAVAFEETPKGPDDRDWDGDAAVQRLRKWASSDGSGEKDTIDWTKYRRGFAWYDDENPENFGSYKLPHHDIIDGRLHVLRSGVIAASNAYKGARGGTDIPAEDRPGVRRHLNGERARWDDLDPIEGSYDGPGTEAEGEAEAEAEAETGVEHDWQYLYEQASEDAEQLLEENYELAEECAALKERVHALEEENAQLADALRPFVT